MLIVKKTTRQYKEFDHQDAYTNCSGWKDEVEIEFNSGQGHKLVVELSLDQARSLMVSLNETINRLDKNKESGKNEAA